jgi:hypothetical protein
VPCFREGSREASKSLWLWQATIGSKLRCPTLCFCGEILLPPHLFLLECVCQFSLECFFQEHLSMRFGLIQITQNDLCNLVSLVTFAKTLFSNRSYSQAPCLGHGCIFLGATHYPTYHSGGEWLMLFKKIPEPKQKSYWIAPPHSPAVGRVKSQWCRMSKS